LIRSSFEKVAADVFIVAADGGIDVIHSDGVFHQLLRRDDHLVLLEVAAERVDLVDAGNAFELRGDDPLLQGAQIGEIGYFLLRVFRHLPFERVLVNLPHGRADRPHGYLDPLGHLLPSFRQALEHQLPGKVDVHTVLEDNGDNRQAKFGNRTHLFDVRQAAHGHFNRVGYISFNFDCRQTIGMADHFNLNVRYIRKGINRQFQI